MLGKILNSRYQIIGKLGGGGFGETYLAIDQWLDGDNQCVVKQLKPDKINPSKLRLFENEAQTLCKLGTHDQIPQLLAHFQLDEEFYLVQELIEGQDLRQEIKTNRRWGETEVVKLLQDILEVLAFVHQNNVIHRDIKPANIMRRHLDGKIVLIDFGGVKQVKTQAESTMLTSVVGTRGYMPDEQFKNNAQLCSDIYAVGVVAIQALTGLEPLEMPRDAKIQLNWRNLVQVSRSLADVLDRMVQFHSSSRYQSASEALDAIQCFSGTGTYWFKRGYELLEWRRYEKAVAAFEQAIQIQPDYYQAWYNCGYALRKLTKYTDAIASYNQAILIKPDYHQAWYSRGWVLDELDRYEEAIASYDQAIKIKPDYYQALYNRGNTLSELKRYEEAIASFSRAIQFQTNLPEAWYSRGMLLYNLERYDEAIASFDQLIHIKQNDPDAWYSRGKALYNLERYKDAIASFDRALLLKPDYQLAVENRKLAENKLRKPFFLRWLGL